jgi:mRNA interferase MazF
MAKEYVPDAGEIVWIHFTPQAGHHQAGHRPALDLSPADAKRVRIPSALPDFHLLLQLK